MPSAKHKEPQVPEESLSIDEVADLVHLDRVTVYREIQRGRLRAERWGRVYRVPCSAIAEYRAANTVAVSRHVPEAPASTGAAASGGRIYLVADASRSTPRTRTPRASASPNCSSAADLEAKIRARRKGRSPR
jgi:excisionase family DNA binding protein